MLVSPSEVASGSLKQYRPRHSSCADGEGEGSWVSLAVVRDLQEVRVPASAEELAGFETDVLAGFVLARAAAGLADATISREVVQLEQTRAWFGRPLWELEPADADAYFGKVLRTAAKGTRLARAQALKTYFAFGELRHQVELHRLTGSPAAWSGARSMR
jgi:integrase/recombinase XerD